MGEKKDLEVTAEYTDGSTKEITEQVSWSVVDTSLPTSALKKNRPIYLVAYV